MPEFTELEIKVGKLKMAGYLNADVAKELNLSKDQVETILKGTAFKIRTANDSYDYLEKIGYFKPKRDPKETDFLKMFIEIEFNSEDSLHDAMLLNRLKEYAAKHFGVKIESHNYDAADYLVNHTVREWQEKLRQIRVQEFNL